MRLMMSDFLVIENLIKWRDWAIDQGAKVEIDGLELALTVENKKFTFMNLNEFIYFCKGMKFVMEFKK